MKKEMMKRDVSEKLQKRILRIQEMEQYYDEVLHAVNACPDAAIEDDVIRKKVQMLEEYCTGGQWLQDYACDERGELPAGLKRGVLSQDGLYNLLCDIWKFRKASVQTKIEGGE